MKMGNYEIQVPFVTTSSDNLKTVIELADIQGDEHIVDLGSGDGRVILEFAKLLRRSPVSTAKVCGFEIKPELVERSRQRIIAAGFQNIVTVSNQSFWDTNLTSYDIIYIYGMQSILGRLEKKLEYEMQPDTIFISNIFKLPHWKPKKSKNNVHLYSKQSITNI